MKKWHGFTLLELLIALFINLSIICFTITGLKEYQQRLEWQETLTTFEKKIMYWQNKAIHLHKTIKIKFIPAKHCFQMFANQEKLDEYPLPKNIVFTTESLKELQFNEKGHFSYLFKIHFSNSKIHKNQSYSLLVGGRLWKKR